MTDETNDQRNGTTRIRLCSDLFGIQLTIRSVQSTNQYVTRKQDIIYVHPIIFYFEPQKLINCLILLLVFVVVVVVPLMQPPPLTRFNIKIFRNIRFSVLYLWSSLAPRAVEIEFVNFRISICFFFPPPRHCPDRSHSQKS